MAKKTNLLRKNALIVTFLFFMIDGNACSAQSIELYECPSLLPKSAIEAIVESYKDWKILEKADLIPDDQMLWDKYRRGECPGVAVGNFDGGGNKKTFAVLIISHAPKKHAKLLLLKRNHFGKYKISLIYEENDVTNFPAIHRGLPGTHRDFYVKEKKVKVKTDVIIYEHIEASAIAFYYKHGKYEQLIISD